MKKLFKQTLAFVMVCTMIIVSAVSVFADGSANTGSVEISFKLGESTLKINGTPVEVQTPYAVGAGVTLVPVRVITEAFGAKVGWDGATKSIPIEYQGVNILLQIGNIMAEVNGTPETLLAPPEISGQSTMVPLRFISETFGATVGYDNLTGAITVTKEEGSLGSTVEGSIDSIRVGDSYYGWSMENPSNMTMDRGFDGGYTYFEYDEDNWIGIIAEKLPKDYNFDDDYNSLKAAASEYTLVASKKETDDPTLKKAYIKYKDKYETNEDYIYATDEYRFYVYYVFSNELKDEQAEASRILSTFKPYFTKDDTHDLSNVEKGYRRYDSEGLKFGLSVPAEFTITSSENIENDITFGSVSEDDNYSVISFAVYSKSEVGSALELCTEDHDRNKLYTNEEIVRFTGIDTANYANISGYEYSYTFNSETIKAVATDVFFEVGEYTYNICVQINKDVYTDFEKITNAVLNSVTAKILDPQHIGVLMRYDIDQNSSYVIKGDKWSVRVPESYEKQSADDEYAIIIDRYTGTTISMSITDKQDRRDNSDLVDELKKLENEIKNSKYTEIISKTKKINAGIYTYNTMGFKVAEKDALPVYNYVFCALRGGKEISVVVSIPEISLSVKTREVYADILGNIVIEP